MVIGVCRCKPVTNRSDRYLVRPRTIIDCESLIWDDLNIIGILL